MTTTDVDQRLTRRLGDAVSMAIDAHGSQLRKGSRVPYASHLLGVCSTVLEMQGDEDVAIAAILHDTIEDGCHEDMPERIEAAYGAHVRTLVEAVSETDGEWETRKQSYLRHLHDAPLDVLRIALADKLYNAHSTLRVPPAVRWERFNRGADQQQWWYESLADAFERSQAAAHPSTIQFVREFRDAVTRIFGPTRDDA